MARPLRIEYPDAVYHVSNRGLGKQRVFPSEKYYEVFLEGLGETCSRLNVQVHAYCLMENQEETMNDGGRATTVTESPDCRIVP